jgi:prepilin-type N-terminal cleavage/methylation domain-containing protein
MRFFKHHNGFSLVEILLAIAISTGTALLVYKVLGDSQRGQVVVENRDEINQLHREVVGKLTNRFVCTATLFPHMKDKKPAPFNIAEFKNATDSIMKFPYSRGRVTLNSLMISKIEESKNQAEVLASYSFKVSGNTSEFKKIFILELSFKDKNFEGCITRGTLGIDPKEACDVVIGPPKWGESYFYNGKCNFAQAACEQTGRKWSKTLQKCDFSEDDLMAIRKEICDLFDMNFSADMKKCIATESMINAFNEMKRLMGNQKSK